MRILAIAFCLFLGAFEASAQPSHKPVSIIFDTDMGPDYDDVGAIAILHAMADKGECKILATIGSNRPPYIATDLNVLNTYFGRPNIPIGVVRDPAVNMRATQGWDSLLAVDFPHKLAVGDSAEDPLVLYRRILAAQPDHSVTIVTVGFFTNMANLLNSKPDKVSSLNGKDLVTRKVKRLVSMAGCFDPSYGHFTEFNVMQDVKASKVVFEGWPTPIIFSGFEIGNQIFTGLAIAHSSIEHSPVKAVFAHSIPMDPQDAKGRMSWDETAVLVAVRGTEPYFGVQPGKIVWQPDGSNQWDSAGKRDLYLTVKMPPAQVGKVIDELMMHVPAH